ncbi:Semaphorin-6C [Pteropus alecto]|uniref:Semaphorin-6C n=1 Tax=Pteropus alecto TaxID=9402 RepID=L5K3W8_PTEAL|nr:Semaphorin-6C [Pteropus alecto]
MPRAPRFMPWLLLLLLSLPHTQAAFPQDPLPLLTSDLQGTSPLSWFRGLEDDAVVAELGLDFQRFLTLNRTLLVAARDHVFSFDLQAQEEGEGLVPNKYLTWRSQDVENCAVRGKLTDECYNYIRVLVPWDSQTLLACGTNSFSPVCRSYGISSLQQEGEELSGQARCPFDTAQSNVAVFAEGSLYSATAADFQASDAVVYRSLGSQPPLRSAKYDSKWLREPHFIHAFEHGDHVYFFFREVSVEDARLGRVQFSRVARVCKRDMGGSPRALDRHWTSFLKLRLNCSVPGDSAFYFDVLQALTGPVDLFGRSALFGVFTTQTNSIPGSAVCAFYLDDIERGFEGKFKEQRSLDGPWTPVSEDRVPSPRPGSCAGVGVAALFPSSRDLPDDVLTFIKAHPLLDPAVPPATRQPLLTLTSRALLTQVAVDGAAGPYGNTTVLFLGSNDGTVLKVLPPGGQPGGREPILLEEIDAYSPSRCSGKRAAHTARRVIGLELDTEGHRLFVAFSGCIIYLPLSRCARHGACRRRGAGADAFQGKPGQAVEQFSGLVAPPGRVSHLRNPANTSSPRLGTLILCRDGKRKEEFEWENQGWRVQKGRERGVQTADRRREEPAVGIVCAGGCLPPKALVFFEANLPFLKNQVLLSETSTRSSPEEMLPHQIPPRTSALGPRFALSA